MDKVCLLPRGPSGRVRGTAPRDLTGRRFGRLVAVRMVGRSEHKKVLWLCSCDCGAETVTSSSLLTKTLRPTRSCGCLVTDMTRAANFKHGLAVRSNGRTATEYTLWQGAKTRAKKEGVPFTIKVTDVAVPRSCPVFPEIELRPNVGSYATPSSPTMDKLIPVLGYTKDNVRVISHKANSCKGSATADELRRVADWIDAELEKNRVGDIRKY